MIRFDEESLMAALDRLTKPLRVVYATSIAERVLPLYVMYHKVTGRGDPDSLHNIITRLWLDSSGERTLNLQELQEYLDLSVQLIPKEDETPWVPEQAGAEDAAGAVAYALRCRQSGLSIDCAFAARRAYEALDNFVISMKSIDMLTPGAEIRVLESPVIQAELTRQQRDLEELKSSRLGIADISRNMRRQAQKDAKDLCQVN